jgi:hypothetical protein
MSPRDLILLVILLAAAVAIVSLLSPHWKRAQELAAARVELLRTALQRTDLDPQMRRALFEWLATEHDRQQRMPGALAILRTMWFTASWLLFIGGAGLFAVDRLLVRLEIEPASVLVVALTGFAMLTLPFVVREWDVRRRVAPSLR